MDRPYIFTNYHSEFTITALLAAARFKIVTVIIIAILDFLQKLLLLKDKIVSIK